MAASDTELFFELTNSVFVQSVASPNQIAGPVFYCDDVKPILLKLLRRIDPQTVEVVALDGVSVTLAIGTPAAVPSVITSATSGTVDGDGFLPIELACNVAGAAAALGTALEVKPTLELRVLFGTTPQRYQTSCTLRQRLITGTLVDTPSPDVATSLNEVMALMVPRNGGTGSFPCSSFVMQDEDNSALQYRGVMRAGELHWEPLQ